MVTFVIFLSVSETKQKRYLLPVYPLDGGQIAREVMANKVFEVLKGTFEISDKSVDKDTFKEESERILQPMRT